MRTFLRSKALCAALRAEKAFPAPALWAPGAPARRGLLFSLPASSPEKFHREGFLALRKNLL